ncbi:abortive infection family protein [Prosthecobacter sp. SYSU 5D2]|uniref:abortive infection family protein n=1 Tax=Prosthecobacter sp. SYSU 5D2 TaxID=3134134 RepID=UPI0031FE51B8
MQQGIPHALARVVGNILGRYYYSHREIHALLCGAGAKTDPPEGNPNCESEITRWLLQENERDPGATIVILGKILEEFMECDFTRKLHTEEEKAKEKARLMQFLADYGMSYAKGGKLIDPGIGAASKTLIEHIREGNFAEIDVEIGRALNAVERDPPAAVTAACSLLESLCKAYIEEESLVWPTNKTLSPLWSVTAKHIGLSPDQLHDNDLKRILSGLFSIVEGIAAFRTHAGSAHGREKGAYRISPRHARFAVNAAHTLASFVMETWRFKRDTKNLHTPTQASSPK